MSNKIFAFIPVLLLLASTAQGASTFTLVPAAGSAYELQGAGVEGAAGFDITLTYDPAVLSAPQVAQGPLLSGAMLAVNPNTPGIVRASAVTLSPVHGSGLVLTITFSRKTGGQGVRALAVRLIDLSGRPLASVVRIAANATTPGEASGTGSDSSTGVTRESGESSSGGTAPEGAMTGQAVVGVVVEQPSSTVSAGQEDRETSANVPPVEPIGKDARAGTEPVRTASTGPEARSMVIYTQDAVLDRFRKFNGPRTMKAYLKLFDREPLIGFRQDPQVILSDGASVATVHFISTPEREHTSDLALMGAKLVSSRPDPDASNTWIVKLLPEKGADRVMLSVPQKDCLMVFPLAVAPKADIDLDRSGTVTAADFSLFLKKRGTKKKPVFDLNKDGKRDYVDDYIFTANYLARMRQGNAVTHKEAGSRIRRRSSVR